MTVSSQHSSRRPYFPALDGVRAIAALMVMACHFCQDKNMGGPWIIGQTGVDLFFVLSGFLITTILLLAPAKDWREVRTFYLRRILRIFPLYYGYLIAAALLGSISSLWFWVYLQNIAVWGGISGVIGPGHFWSLAVEEQFYLIWPFLVFFLPRQWLTRTLWAIVAMAVFFRILIFPLHIHSYLLVMFSRFDGLAAGALLASYYQRNLLQRHRRGLLLLAVLSAVVIWFQWWKFHSQGAPWVQVTKFSLATSFYAAVVGYLIINGPILANRLLRLSPLRFIGKISYGLYVFHPAIFTFVLLRVRSLSTVVQLLACFGATFLVSIISWYGYEVWFIRLKDKLAPERSRQSLPVAA
jgi:peptidoglycan/LPS O-acetylase OafA/YrhL